MTDTNESPVCSIFITIFCSSSSSSMRGITSPGSVIKPSFGGRTNSSAFPAMVSMERKSVPMVFPIMLPYPIILSIPMPETWTLTPMASNDKELYSLMSAIRGSTCRVSPYEHRGGVRGVFGLLIQGVTGKERPEVNERIKRVGLRRITEEERRAIEAELLLPGQVPSVSPASLSPVPQPHTPPPA